MQNATKGATLNSRKWQFVPSRDIKYTCRYQTSILALSFLGQRQEYEQRNAKINIWPEQTYTFRLKSYPTN